MDYFRYFFNLRTNAKSWEMPDIPQPTGQGTQRTPSAEEVERTLAAAAAGRLPPWQGKTMQRREGHAASAGGSVAQSAQARARNGPAAGATSAESKQA